MLASKAVIFTHIPVPLNKESTVYTARMAQKLIARIMPYIKAYLLCRNIGLIYIYVDTGIRITLQHLAEQANTLQFPIGELEFEQSTRNCLRLAVDRTISDLSRDDPTFQPSSAPKIQFIGLPHLLSLIHSLYRIDSRLLRDLAGSVEGRLKPPPPDGEKVPVVEAGREQSFTYDSPKFVEAVIRLVRGAHPTHGLYPIFRVDEDVEVNETAIGILLDEAREALQSQLQPYSFFSGGYGTVNQPVDPVNDFAVRLHWLVDRKTHTLSSQGWCFLRDLGEFGATQVSSDKPLSSVMSDILQNSPDRAPANRDSQQVISGAGLFMSRSAIETLPPFMNFRNLITWIDDHLKRRLHEVLGHITAEDIEHVGNALIKQNRHQKGITDKDIKWAADLYFERLLSGCIMHALITTPEGEKGVFATEVEAVLQNLRITFDEKVLRNRLTDLANKTALSVLNIWTHADYGSAILSDWAGSMLEATDRIAQLTSNIVDDAISYLHLVSRWPHYLAAISKLTPVHAYWLFRTVES